MRGTGFTKTVAAALATLALAGCEVNSRGGGTTRQQLGLAAPPPDEFLVVSRRPLQRPPDMTALPAPDLGAPSRVEPDPQADARAALTGGAMRRDAAATAPSAGEAALLRAAGADQAEPDVRERIVAETPEPERRYGLDSILGYEIVQDPAREADRLQGAEEVERLRAEGLPAPALPPQADAE